MGRVEVKVKTSFGEIVVEGASPQEILSLLESFPKDFTDNVSTIISSKLAPSAVSQLKGIVEFTTEGPVLITREKLTHYEAIGLILYASENRQNTAAQIQKLLESSGIKCMVPARLNEMTRRGQVFKPDPKKPEFKLTIQGERWVEDEVLARLRGKTV
ncbi:MAG: hypothetical protein N3F10_01860 [Candidatus Bathyarchaeota archaeon]|nr:hypothetical protein [Candidatus Bathyarchaeota archaeon]MCX8177029.1 hypothetical protein [Candidatus Bathyarchaeota archaeon]MDW8194232.1 hypothetical protein [Nitrososphaerota archaeon]